MSVLITYISDTMMRILPKSPDLNPIDYKIWGIIQQRV